MSWSSIQSKSICVFILALSVCVSAFPQTGTTSLRGVITDKSGGSIAGANIKLSNSQTALERATKTAANGEYEFLALPPGTYTLTVEMTNFQKYEQLNLQLLVNSPATQDITLSVGSTMQMVEVSAQVETLNTSDASLGTAFNENQVKQLPMEGRNVPDLLSLQPGVAYTGNRTDVPTWDTRNGAVNGARSDQSNVTVDGISVNDEGGHAFTSVLPVTLDSVQEFRVSTSNYNADQGGSSGAQTALVTKSGTNSFHGSAYEYHRNTYTSANDYFVKAAQIDNCLSNGIDLSEKQCNSAPKLIRNIFGGAIGGPIKKDRLFFFLNYEGTRRAEAQSVTDVVPSNTLRDGIMQYLCQTNPDGSLNTTACPGGSVSGLSGKSYTVQPGYYALSPSQLTGMDPLHLGPNTAILNYLNTWPAPNTSGCGGDGFNYSCFNYSAPISENKNEYIAKLDYNITSDAKHHISLTGALRNDSNPGAPFYPGLLPSQSIVNYNKGIIANYNGVISSTLVNSFRYGFIRESVGIIGNSTQDWILLRGLNDQTGPPEAITRTHSFQRPIHSFADDLSWIKGKHTLQFGGQFAFIRTPSISYLTSYSDGSANASWTDTAGYAQKSSSPLNPVNSGFPQVDASFANSYDFPLTALLGMVTEVDARYNFQRDGSPLSDGTPIKRRFAINSYETYVQDVWKVKPTLTLTLGLRYSLFSPPWETNKLEVTPTTSMDQWFLNRAAEGQAGLPSNLDPLITFDWAGKANGKPGYYNWDYKDLGPRLAFAWAPRMKDGLLGDLLGEGKTSIRGGFGLVYDRFGQGIADDFSQYGSFGLSTELTNSAAVQTVSSAPRATDIHSVPQTDNTGAPIFLPAPPANFPVQFPTGTFFIGSTIDRNLKTPYAYALDFSIARELKGGFTFEAAYVGRLSRRLLMQLDTATPLDLKDPGTGVDYFTAVRALAQVYRQQLNSGNLASTTTFNPASLPPKVAQYWADMMAPAQASNPYALSSCTGTNSSGNPNVLTTMNPVVAAYDLFCGNNLNETTGLYIMDQFGLNSFAGATDPNCGTDGNACGYLPKGGAYSYYNPQFATLYMFKSMGTANYNAAQFSLRHKMTHGVQFDFNYTYSKSIDLASDAERVGTIGGNGAQIQNAFSPFQFRAPSDFDATHQITANWIAELPFGRNRAIGRNINGVADAFIGGWQLSGLTRWESGFPFSVTNGYQWPTDWDLSGNAYQTAPLKVGTFHNPSDPSIVSAFSNFSAAQGSFREPFPGEAGQRNNLRGPGYFTMDMGLSKRWHIPGREGQSLQLRWEVFNVFNTVRFDPLSINAVMDYSGSSFGQYTRLSTNPRVMQFALRYEF